MRNIVFNTIIIIVCGEAILAVVMSVMSYIKRGGAAHSREFGTKQLKYIFLSYFRGGGALYHVLAAIVGTYSYWYLFDVTTNYGGSNEYSKGVFALLTIFLLVVVAKVKGISLAMPKWEFHGVRKW